MLFLNREQRIGIERIIMSEEMPQFSFVRTREEQYFEGWCTTSTGNKYKLKLKLTEHYPDQIPSLYVDSPHTLKRHSQGSVNSLGSNHAFHTNENGPNGCVQICHFSKETWDASRTTIQVLAMGMLWLECHSLHLITGSTISEISEELEKRLIYKDGNDNNIRRYGETELEKIRFASSYLDKLSRKDIHRHHYHNAR